MQLKAPFDGEATTLINTINRFYRVQWGDSKHAFVEDYWWNTRNTKMYAFDPSDNKNESVIVYDVNYQNAYQDPGNLVTRRNQYAKSVVSLKK